MQEYDSLDLEDNSEDGEVVLDGCVCTKTLWLLHKEAVFGPGVTLLLYGSPLAT